MLRRCSDYLTNYEQSEILEYQHVYFMGKCAHKIKGTPHAGMRKYSPGNLFGAADLFIYMQNRLALDLVCLVSSVPSENLVLNSLESCCHWNQFWPEGWSNSVLSTPAKHVCP